MKKQIVLSREDIQQALANSFNVDTDRVQIECFMDVEGLGPGERLAPQVKATIEVPMVDRR